MDHTCLRRSVMVGTGVSGTRFWEAWYALPHLTLPVEFTGVETFPGDGSTHSGFSTAIDVNRDAYGVDDFKMPLGLERFA